MNLRGYKRVRSLGFGMLALLFVLMVSAANGTELKQFMSYQQADRTELVFEFDKPVQIPAPTEEGLDLILRLEGVDVTALPQQADVQTPQVARILVDHAAHEIRIQRARLFPFEYRFEGPRFILVIRDVQAPVKPEASSNTLQEKTSESKEPEAEKESDETSSPSKTDSFVTIEGLQILTTSEDGISVLIQTTKGTEIEAQWSRLENPIRWVLDLSPAHFRPARWIEHPEVKGVREIRAAQFRVSPVPITRIVFEMTEDIGQPDLVRQEHEIIARLDFSEAVPIAEQQNEVNPDAASTASEETIAEAAEPVPSVVEQSVKEQETLAPTEEIEPSVKEPSSGEVQPEQTSVVSSEPEEASPAEPGVKETQTESAMKNVSAPPVIQSEQPAVDPEFFSTRDIMFYQAEGEETPEEARRLAIFEERAISGAKRYEGEPVTLKFTNIEITDLMTFFSDISGLNIVLDPSVKGPAYQIPLLNLVDVPWDQAFDLVCRMLGLGYILEGNVLRVAPVEVLAKEAEERAKLAENVGELVTIMKPLSFANAAEVKALAEQLLTPRGEILIDQRTNTLIIKETDQNINNITNLIDTLDKPIPQVNIEARIVQTRRTFSQALGIQWGFQGLVSPAFGNQTSLVFPNNISLFGNTLVSQTGGIGGNPLGGYAVNLPTQQAPNAAILMSFGSVMDTFRLDAALMALENEGLARVLQSPRVSTQNNKEAIIKSGFQIPVQTIVNNTIQVRFVDATLTLQVTPQITADGSVIMNVKIENKRPDFTQPVLGIPPILTQEASTTLLVKDGETAVLGGIIQSQDEVSHGKVPWFHRIPILGWLFKNKNVNRTNDELLIFLTPRIVK